MLRIAQPPRALPATTIPSRTHWTCFLTPPYREVALTLSFPYRLLNVDPDSDDPLGGEPARRGVWELSKFFHGRIDFGQAGGDKEKQFPQTLSGGEQQRVGIARAVVNKPPIVLADEPTGNLDPELSREIMQLFLDFNQVGVTVLIATHDLDLVARLGKRELQLRQGKLVGGQN